MTLSNMLLSPHVAEFRLEVEHWVQLLQELGNVNWATLPKWQSDQTPSNQKAWEDRSFFT